MRTKRNRGGAGIFGNWGKTFTDEQKEAGRIRDEEINLRKEEILAVNTPAAKFIVGCIANFNNSQQFVNQFNKSTNIDSSACGSATCNARAQVIQSTLDQLLAIANKPNGAQAFASLQTKELAKGMRSYFKMDSELGNPSPQGAPQGASQGASQEYHQNSPRSSLDLSTGSRSSLGERPSFESSPSESSVNSQVSPLGSPVGSPQVSQQFTPPPPTAPPPRYEEPKQTTSFWNMFGSGTRRKHRKRSRRR